MSKIGNEKEKLTLTSESHISLGCIPVLCYSSRPITFMVVLLCLLVAERRKIWVKIYTCERLDDLL